MNTRNIYISHDSCRVFGIMWMYPDAEVQLNLKKKQMRKLPEFLQIHILFYNYHTL